MNIIKSATSFLAKIAEGVAEGRRMRQAYDQLSRLTDRELDDIGITRGEIHAAVAGVTIDRAKAAASLAERTECAEDGEAAEPIAA